MKIRVYSCLFLLSVLSVVHAQQSVTSATLSGRVEDVRGASINGASVLATHHETNQQQSTTTDSEGRYRFLTFAPAPTI